VPNRIGITGHQDLADPTAWAWVRDTLRTIVAEQLAPLVAVSSLARGADQLFAEVALEAGGILYAVIPFPGYERTLDREHLARYSALLARAQQEVGVPMESDESAYWAAGKRVVDLSDLLVAVWNGKPARGRGGTADVVAYAIQVGKRVIHVNPDDRSIHQASHADTRPSPDPPP
jgi:hypothetical protein